MNGLHKHFLWNFAIFLSCQLLFSFVIPFLWYFCSKTRWIMLFGHVHQNSGQYPWMHAVRYFWMAGFDILAKSMCCTNGLYLSSCKPSRNLDKEDEQCVKVHPILRFNVLLYETWTKVVEKIKLTYVVLITIIVQDPSPEI